MGPLPARRVAGVHPEKGERRGAVALQPEGVVLIGVVVFAGNGVGAALADDVGKPAGRRLIDPHPGLDREGVASSEVERACVARIDNLQQLRAAGKQRGLAPLHPRWACGQRPLTNLKAADSGFGPRQHHYVERQHRLAGSRGGGRTRQQAHEALHNGRSMKRAFRDSALRDSAFLGVPHHFSRRSSAQKAYHSPQEPRLLRRSGPASSVMDRPTVGTGTLTVAAHLATEQPRRKIATLADDLAAIRTAYAAERLRRALDDANATLDGLLSSGPTPLIRPVELRLSSRELATEADVEALLAEIRDELMAQIAAGSRVRIV